MIRSQRSILIVGYDGIANPATRLRALQFIPWLERDGYIVETFIRPTQRGAGRGGTLLELWRSMKRADIVFVQRVLAGPINLMLRAARARVVFDVDDALQYIRQNQYDAALDPRTPIDRARSLYRRVVRGGRFYSARKRPLDDMLRIADAVVAGNAMLRDAFATSTRRMLMIPTSVDVDSIAIREHAESRPVRIGWIGVASNLLHLELLGEVFERLEKRFGDGVKLVVVCNRSYEGTAVDTEFVPWSLETESAEVARFDIGLMPLQDDLFSRGKCSFKAIYCMAHGVPVVISPVGMNAELIEHGVNGYLASTIDDWTDALGSLIEDHQLRARIGAAARSTIEREYDAHRAYGDLVRLFDQLLGARSRRAPAHLPQQHTP